MRLWALAVVAMLLAVVPATFGAVGASATGGASSHESHVSLIPFASPVPTHTFPLTYSVVSPDTGTDTATSGEWASPVGASNFIYNSNGDMVYVNASTGTNIGYGTAATSTTAPMTGVFGWDTATSGYKVALGANAGTSSPEYFPITTTSIASTGSGGFGNGASMTTYTPIVYNSSALMVYTALVPSTSWSAYCVTTSRAVCTQALLGLTSAYQAVGGSLNSTSGNVDFTFVLTGATYSPVVVSKFQTGTNSPTICSKVLSVGGDALEIPQTLGVVGATGTPNGDIWVVGKTVNTTGWYLQRLTDACASVGSPVYLGPATWGVDTTMWGFAGGFMPSNNAVALMNVSNTATTSVASGWFYDPSTASFSDTATVSLATGGWPEMTAVATASGLWFALVGTNTAQTTMESYVFGLAAVPLPPPPVTGVTVSGITADSAVVSWTQAAGGGIVNNTVYLYHGATCGGTPTAKSTGGAATSYDLTGLASSASYSVVVTAWNATGQSAPSSCVAFTAGSTVPPPPTSVAVRGVSYTNATVYWVQSAGGGIVNNTVYLFVGILVCSGTSSPFSTAGAATVFGMTLLAPGTDYAVYVTAWNATGQSAPSGCVGFTTTSVSPPPPSAPSSPWMWILLVVIGGLFVLGLVYRRQRTQGTGMRPHAERSHAKPPKNGASPWQYRPSDRPKTWQYRKR